MRELGPPGRECKRRGEGRSEQVQTFLKPWMACRASSTQVLDAA